jgi:hypothetical protein
VLIPDHTPQMACAAPWHAGMAHTLGFMRAAIMTVERCSSELLHQADSSFASKLS